MGAERKRLEGLVEHLSQREVDAVDLELARLDLREVQDVVDDDEQRFGRLPDGLQVVALDGRHLGLERQLRHAEDAVHRRANLVAHVRQELALGMARLLGDPHRLGQLGGALSDLSIEVRREVLHFAVELILLVERLRELLVGIREAPLHPVDVVLELRNLPTAWRRRRRVHGARLTDTLRTTARRSSSGCVTALEKRPAPSTAPPSASADEHQRQRVVVGGLEPHAHDGMFDEHPPSGSGHAWPCQPDARRVIPRDLGSRRRRRRRPQRPLNQRCRRQVLQACPARGGARVNHAVVLVDDGHIRVGERAELSASAARLCSRRIPQATPASSPVPSKYGAATTTGRALHDDPMTSSPRDCGAPGGRQPDDRATPRRRSSVSAGILAGVATMRPAGRRS